MLIGEDFLNAPEIRYRNNKAIAASKIEIMRYLLKTVPADIELTVKNFYWFSLVAEIFRQHTEYANAKLLGLKKVKMLSKFSSNCFSYRYKLDNNALRTRPVAIKVLCK